MGELKRAEYAVIEAIHTYCTILIGNYADYNTIVEKVRKLADKALKINNIL